MNSFINNLNALSAQWLTWHVGMFWQIAVLILIILTIDTLIKNRTWPQVRYALWLMLVLKLILPPSFALNTSITSGIQPVIDNNIEIKSPALIETITQPKLTTAETPISTNSTTAPIAKPTPQQTLTTPPAPQAEPLPKVLWHSWLMLTWLAGILAMAALLISRIRKLNGYNTNTIPLPDNIARVITDCKAKLNLKRSVRVIVSEQAVSPFVYGIVKPTVILPADSLTEISEADLRHHLLHELAHIKRGDLLVHGGYVVVQLLYWFNPLVWIIGRQVRHLREICCDTAVAAVLKEDTRNYRQTLLETARRLLAEPVEPTMGLLGLFEDSSKLLARLKWLEKPTWKTRKLQYTSAIAVGLIMICCILPMAKGQEKVNETTTEQWQTISSCTQKLLGSGPAVAIIKDVQWLSPSAYDNGQKTIITINHSYNNTKCRILCKKTDGTEVISNGGTSVFNNNLCTMQIVIDSPIKDIESYSLQIFSNQAINSNVIETNINSELTNYLQELHDNDQLNTLDNHLSTINEPIKLALSHLRGNDTSTAKDRIEHIIYAEDTYIPSLVKRTENSPISDDCQKIVELVRNANDLLANNKANEATKLLTEIKDNYIQPLKDKIAQINKANPSHTPERKPTELKGYFNIISPTLIQYDALDGEIVSKACRRAIEALEYSVFIKETEKSTSYKTPYHAEGVVTYKDENYDHTGYKSYIESKDENQKLIRCEFITLPDQPSTVSLTCETKDREALFKQIAIRLYLSELKLWPESMKLKFDLPANYQNIVSMCDMYSTINDAVITNNWDAAETIAEQVGKVIDEEMAKLKGQYSETLFQIQIFDFYIMNDTIKNHDKENTLELLNSINKMGNKLKQLQNGSDIDQIKPKQSRYRPNRIEINQQMLDYFNTLEKEKKLSNFTDFINSFDNNISFSWKALVAVEKKQSNILTLVNCAKVDLEVVQEKFPDFEKLLPYATMTKKLESLAGSIKTEKYQEAAMELQDIMRNNIAVIQSHLTRVQASKPGLPFFPDTYLKGNYKVIGPDMLSFDTNDFPIVSHVCERAVTILSHYDSDYQQCIKSPGLSSGNNTSTGELGMFNGMKSYVAGNDKYGNKFRCEMIVISGQPIMVTLEDSSGDYRLLNEILNQLGYTYLKSMPDNATTSVTPPAADDPQDKAKYFYNAFMAAGNMCMSIENAVQRADWATAEKLANDIVKLADETMPKLKGDPTEPIFKALMAQFDLMHKAIKAHDKDKTLKLFNSLNEMGGNVSDLLAPSN